MSDWLEAPIIESSSAADGLYHLALDVAGTGLSTSHTLAGQYVKLSLEGKGEGYFAIASAPGRGERFDFLIKTGSPLADALCQLPLQGRVRLTAAAGKGFPIAAARGKNLLLFATGSGISAVRSAIEQIRTERDLYGEVTLFFGARTPSAFAYLQELERWEQSRIRIVRTVSQPGNTGWQGLVGYVQAHLSEVKVDNTLALLVGQKTMVQGVTEALQKRGLAKENIFLNF